VWIYSKKKLYLKKHLGTIIEFSHQQKYLTMNKLLTLLSFALLSFNAISQGYDDLKMLYTDESYEKLFKKCEKYINNEKTANDPLPYLYFSMANFRLSQQQKFALDYPKAYSDAVSYAGKFVKKDSKKGDYKDYELKVRYFEELKSTMVEETENYFTEGDDKSFKKAASSLKKMSSFDPEDRSVTIVRAIAEMKSNNKTEGKKLMAEGTKHLKQIGVDVLFDSMSESTQYFYRFALIEYTKYLVELKNFELAKEIISLGHQYFYSKNDAYKKEYSPEYKELYDKLNL
jgi:hypothetical protein